VRTRRDLAEAVVPHVFEGVEAKFGDTVTDVCAEIAIHRIPNLVVTLPSEAYTVDGRDGRQGRENEAR
jgi:hypothetical protein